MLFSQGKTQSNPIDAGYDESRIALLNNHLDRLVNDNRILCGNYCITRKGKVIAHNGIGKQSYRKDDNRTVPFDAIHYVASITKLFVATSIMKLVEDGLVRLDQKVCEILPQFSNPPFNTITVFGLLTHTSGMHPDENCFPNDPVISYWDAIDALYKDHDPKSGEFDWIAASLKSGVKMAEGKEWRYCSFGYVILGAIIEKITGVKAETFIEENIAKPLGMNDTTFKIDANKKDRWIIQTERNEKRILSNTTEDDELWSRIPRTGGGLNSTAYDLTIFGNCILNNGTLNGIRILGRKAVEKMTTMAIHNIPDYCWGSNTPSRGYGVGFDMRQGSAFTFSKGTYNHEGAGASALYIDPVEELVAAWFVPWVNPEEWHADALWNVINIIWSGII